MSPDDKPFACNAPGCGMSFTTEDHLTVHKRKHEMSLALNSPGSSTRANAHCSLFVADQTPTPTKFLRNCDEIGLFHELSKNPFEEAFKKASDGLAAGLPLLPGPTLDTPQALDTPTTTLIHSISRALHAPLPGPTLDTPTHILDTPTPALLRPLARVDSEDIPELSTDNIITIPLTEVNTPVPPVEAVSTTARTTANDAIRVKQEPIETTAAQSFPTSASPAATVPSPKAEVELFASGGAPAAATQPMASPPVTMVTQETSPAVAPSPAGIPVPMATLSPQILKGGVASVQMFLQLPGGQTIPVNIPAAIADPHAQAAQLAANSETGEAVTVTTATSSSAMTKQKLKAALSQNQQQSLLNSNMMVMTEAVERVTSMEAMEFSSPESSPTSIPTFVSSTLPRQDVVSPFESTSFCDPDSSTVPTKRSRITEEDPDERRRKFLERNRAAAARCRYKRKAWINGLEKKSDDLVSLNQRLTSEITVLKTEIAQLKSLLLAHKNCPVTLQQKEHGQINLVQSLEEMDTLISTATTSPGVTVVNTAIASGTSALKQIQNKATPITMVAAKPGNTTIRSSPVPVTFLSQNQLPIASASNAVSLATVTPTTVAGGVNPTYIIVTNQPTKGQS